MKNFKIALVDDDPMILTMLKLRLQDLSNVEVNTFNSGEDFLNGIELFKPDIIICDYHMDSINEGAMTGAQLIAKLNNDNIDIPVIVLSSQRDIAVATEMLKFQVVDYLEKTQDYPEQLIKSVIELMSMLDLNKKMGEVETVLKKDNNRLLSISLAFAVGVSIAIIFLQIL